MEAGLVKISQLQVSNSDSKGLEAHYFTSARCIRLLKQVRPKFAIFENVRNLLSIEEGRLFQEVLFQIAKAGYMCEWSVISARDVGGCHLRERVWLLCYPSDSKHARSFTPERLYDSMVKQTQVHRKGRTKLSNLREQVNPEAVKLFNELQQIKLPTPTTRDWKDSGDNMNYKKAAEKKRLAGVLNHTHSNLIGEGTTLNPQFVEIMMGFPKDYTLVS